MSHSTSYDVALPIGMGKSGSGQLYSRMDERMDVTKCVRFCEMCQLLTGTILFLFYFRELFFTVGCAHIYLKGKETYSTKLKWKGGLLLLWDQHLNNLESLHQKLDILQTLCLHTVGSIGDRYPTADPDDKEERSFKNIANAWREVRSVVPFYWYSQSIWQGKFLAREYLAPLYTS